MKKIIFCIVLIFDITQFYAQQNYSIEKLDSLLKHNRMEKAKIIINAINKDTLSLSKQNKARYYYLLGSYYEKNDKEDIAFKYLKKSGELYKQIDSLTKFMDVNYNLFLLLISRENLKQDAKKYLDKIHQFAIQKKDTTLLTKAFFGYAVANSNTKNNQNALKYYDKLIALNKGNTKVLAKVYNNKGAIYNSNSKTLDSARYYFKKAIAEYNKLGKNREQFATTFNLGLSYLKGKDYSKTIKWLKKADLIPLKKYKKNYKRLLYQKLAETYEKNKDYKNALSYLKKHIQYKDSVDIANQNIAISDMETKYKAIQKEKENLQLKAEKKQQKYILIGSLGLFFATFIFGVLLYRNLKQKKDVLEKQKKIAEKQKEIEHQKVVNLVKEQEILAMDAMLEGQEQERLRLAEDLHDNLGSTIATLKMHFDTYKNITNKINPDQDKALKNTEKLLDETYQKVRYMAHTNQVSVMETHGLITSLKLLVQKLSEAKQLQVELNYFGFEKRLNSKLELNIFRIIQEILTNIIKHANATEITIDINLFEDILTVIIEDNGIGFDAENTLKDQNKGMGLKNLIKRVKRENGKISLDSQIGIGTAIVIEIPIIITDI